MGYKKRKFIPGECMHVYQRTINGFNIFYDREDFIVFYTIFSVVAKAYDIVVLEMCMMIDHVHMLLSSESMSEISDFVRHYTSLFVRVYNDAVSRKGPLFHKSFGSAPKKGSKKIRSTIVYIGNNPVEKTLCPTADKYRWNYLAYIGNANPFSEPKPLSSCSVRLRNAMKEVDKSVSSGRFLSYAQTRRMFGKLSDGEKEILTDHIIKAYGPFDEEVLLSFYDSKEDMLHAMKATAGSDYDIKEKYYSGSDMIYRDMMRVAMDYCGAPVRTVTVMKPDLKFELAKLLQQRTNATMMQISKFLHLKLSKVRDEYLADSQRDDGLSCRMKLAGQTS